MSAKIKLTGTLELPGGDPYENAYCIPDRMKSYLSLETHSDTKGRSRLFCSHTQYSAVCTFSLMAGLKLSTNMHTPHSQHLDHSNPCQGMQVNRMTVLPLPVSLSDTWDVQTDKNFTLTILKVFNLCASRVANFESNNKNHSVFHQAISCDMHSGLS